MNLPQCNISDECFSTVVKPLLKILSKALQELLSELNNKCFSAEVQMLLWKVYRELDYTATKISKYVKVVGHSKIRTIVNKKTRKKMKRFLSLVSINYEHLSPEVQNLVAEITQRVSVRNKIVIDKAQIKAMVKKESKIRRGLLINLSQVSINDESFATNIKPLLEIFSKTLHLLLYLLSFMQFKEESLSSVCETLTMLLEKASQVQCGMKLRNINMISNNLSRVPNFTCDSMFEDTSDIDLSFNKILDLNSSYLPTKLQVLNLSFNRLEFIPSLAPLSVLRELDISHNRIRKVAGLPAHLEKLRLWSNPLEELSQDCFPNEGVYVVVKRAVFPYMLSALQIPPADICKQGYTEVINYFGKKLLILCYY